MGIKFSNSDSKFLFYFPTAVLNDLCYEISSNFLIAKAYNYGFNSANLNKPLTSIK